MTLAPWPCFDEEQVQAAASVLRSGKVNYWTGTETREFEKEFAAWNQTAYAIAINNGTVTLELIAHALGLQPGDEVITTPRTFLASASAFVTQGIKPVFADVDRDSGCISPETVATHITSKTRAIVPVHLGGWPCDMKGLQSLVEGKGIHLIEDCAQAHGAEIDGQSVGSFGIANSWSFCQDKIMTTGGEGGMITTDDEDLWKAMWSRKDHGKDYDAVYNRQHPIGFRWLHEHWGTNGRMTEFQAVLGRIQLKRMEEWRRERTRNAEILVDRLKDCPAFRIPLPGEGLTHAWYRLYVYVEDKALKDGWNRDRIQSECAARGFGITVGSCSEIYKEVCFGKLDLRPSAPLPVTKELGETSLAFLVHPGITEAQLHRVADVVLEAASDGLR